MTEQQLTLPATQGLVGETRPPIALPAIEYAEGVHQLADVEVDAGYFGHLMAQMGMGEADIAATTIRITAELETKRGKTRKEKDTIVSLGHHYPTTGTVEVNIASIKYAVHGSEKIDGPFKEGEADDMATWLASETGVHEILHRIEEALGRTNQEAEDAYFEKVVPQKFRDRLFLKLLRMSRDPMHRELAETLRAIEIGEAQLNPRYEHYDSSPTESRVEERMEEIMGQFEYVDDYPIQVRLKQPSAKSKAPA